MASLRPTGTIFTRLSLVDIWGMVDMFGAIQALKKVSLNGCFVGRHRKC